MKLHSINQVAEALADNERKYFFNKEKQTVSSLPVFATQDTDFEMCVRVDLERTPSGYIPIAPLDIEELIDLYYDFALRINAPNLLHQLDQMQQAPKLIIEEYVAQTGKQSEWHEHKTTFFTEQARNWINRH